MNMYEVRWKDHYLLEGWFDRDAVKLDTHINTSIGYFVTRNKEYTVFAMTHCSNETTMGDLLYVLNKDIVSMMPLKIEGDSENESGIN